jgi:valyl-tRNA synthetase
MEKTYQATAVEAKHYAKWEKAGAFACDPTSNRQPYCIMMPPPNVTGSLHMGHALTFTLQDVLIRYNRMQGKDALWQPGTDHAGIATQMIVERQLAAQKLNRHDMGRAKFLDKVWEWKEESGGTITRQLRRLGTSPDWARERFTMDEGLNKAVSKVFVELYRKGLIYKDNRLVNWDPKLLTAISDLEVEQREVKGHMWHFRYPLVDDPTKYICIATTRPETMLGDGAVAVNPNDERYKHLIGKLARLPLAERLIPIIADEHADPEKGSGAVKITAAHDFNDFAVWQRHKDKDYFKKQKDGGLINLFDARARMNENAPASFQGLDRYEARKKVIADLEEAGLIDKIEPLTHSVPHGDRSGVVIEPWLTEQWYCNAEELAKPAMKAVEEGKTQFVPKQWENTYFEWMRNIQPWCISRQLWWGHQIPAWYGPDGKVYVAETEAEAQKEAGAGVALKRDEDVLDTWFSSALWPFSTLGWPEKTPELNRYYPGDVLVTGFDIIFFWVARMMMMGLHFMEDVPFRKIYIHALVRDEKGQKMSKTKGNVIDPLDMIDQYGTDALRFTLTSLSTPGRDIRLATSRIESGRNFATKLWNAARFCEMNDCKWVEEFDPLKVKQPVNGWVILETNKAIQDASQSLENFRFDEFANGLYHFVRDQFCDWYLELAKPLLQSDATVHTNVDDANSGNETRATCAWVLDKVLCLLHPIMPFISEEIAENFFSERGSLISRNWPEPTILNNVSLPHFFAKKQIEWVIDVINLIRSVRSELNVPVAVQVPLIVNGASEFDRAMIETYKGFILRLARVANFTFDKEAQKGSAQVVLRNMTFVLPLADIIDLVSERARIEKECTKLKAEIERLNQKLGNPQFVDNAPNKVIAEHNQRLENARTTLSNLEAARARLSA